MTPAVIRLDEVTHLHNLRSNSPHALPGALYVNVIRVVETREGPTPASHHGEGADGHMVRRVSVNGIGSFISVFSYFIIIGFSLHFNSLHLFDWFLIRTPLQNNRTSSSRSLSHFLYQEYQPSKNATTSSSEFATTECPTAPFCFQRPSRRWWWRTHEMTPTPPLLPPIQHKSTVTTVDVVARTPLLAACPQFSAVSISTASV